MVGAQYFNKFDLIYSFSLEDVRKLSDTKISSKYLPIGADDKIYCNKDKVYNKDYDISFVGSKSKDRLQYLECIAKYCIQNNKKFIVYGHYWHNNNFFNELISRMKFTLKYPNLVKFIKNYDLLPQKVSELYLRSKICFNLHIERTGEINARVFEIMGNGNFQLVDNNPAFEKLGIINNKHLCTYDNLEDCIEKIGYFLKNDDKRMEICKEAKNIVTEYYTMDKTMMTVLEDIRRLRNER